LKKKLVGCLVDEWQGFGLVVWKVGTGHGSCSGFLQQLVLLKL